MPAARLNNAIDVASLYPGFEKLLADERNERILFSARFGTGKTYFLEEFFKEKADEYVTIKLFPVNYSVASNEDIFRLIKYDILYELVKLAPTTMHRRPLELPYALMGALSAMGVGGKFSPILSALTKLTAAALPLLNKDAGDQFGALTTAFEVIKAVRVAAKDYFALVEKMREGTTHTEQVEDFWEEVEQSHLLEIDFITQFIVDSLHSLATGAIPRRKRKVLIIDDLDRLDPEHLFRLFNIFSAHFDYRKQAGNKFGFDHVIFVGDLANIHSLFAARYGKDTDKSGYLDKFYSTEPYHFDNAALIGAEVEAILKQLKFEGTADQQKRLHDYIFQTSLKVLPIAQTLGNAGAISIRRLVSVSGRTFSLRSKAVPQTSVRMPNRLTTLSTPVVAVLEVITWMIGGVAATKLALGKLVLFDSGHDYSDQDALLSWCLPLADYENFFKELLGRESHRNHTQRQDAQHQLVVYVCPINNGTYRYHPVSFDGFDPVVKAQVESVNGVVERNNNSTHIGGFAVLLAAFNKLVELGYFDAAT